MKNYFLLSLLAILFLNCQAQVEFEKGYFIDNEDKRTDCFIKNLDWKNNPSKFEYNESGTGEAKTIGIEKVKEFAIVNYKKFYRFTVDIDRSKNQVGNLSYERKPSFSRDTLFLESLLEGKASLYYYEEETLKRYFYKLQDSSEAKQLVYKRYLTRDDQIRENAFYKQQLYLEVRWEGATDSDSKGVEYRKNSLTKYFEKYNKNSNSAYVIHKALKDHNDLFNIYLRGGIVYSSLSINAASSDLRDADFGSQFSYTFGLEAEFVLPTNKNKWSVPFEVSYRYFKGEQDIQFQKVAIDYQVIDFSLAVRYFVFFNEHSKAFANGGYQIGAPLNSVFEYEKSIDLDVSTSNNFFVGIGYKYKSFLQTELRYGFSRNILASYGNWTNKYPSIALMVGIGIM